jgi:hypothetical protein
MCYVMVSLHGNNLSSIPEVDCAQGPWVRCAGDEICAMPTPVAATETAALVLVDRALDIVTPLAHGDHVMDQIYGMLHRRGQAPSCGNRWFLSAVSAQWLFLRHDDLIYAIAGVGHDSSVLESVRDQMPVLPCRPSDVVVPLPTLFRDCLEAGPPGSHSNPQLTRTVLDDRDKQDGSCVSSGLSATVRPACMQQRLCLGYRGWIPVPQKESMLAAEPFSIAPWLGMVIGACSNRVCQCSTNQRHKCPQSC